MSHVIRRNGFYVIFVILIGLAFLPKLFLGSTALYTKWLSARILLYIGSLSRLLFLLIGFVLARRAASHFEADNPVRPAWGLLAWGLLSYFMGQSVLAVYQLGFSVAAPFPSLGDVFFLLAMLLWLVSLVMFLRAYAHAGLLERGARRFLAAALTSAAVLALVGYGLLKPILETPAPTMEKALNIAYPVSDLLLLIPVIVLLQTALKLRGGKLWWPWMALLGGFICLALGDILFAYFTTLGKETLDPLLDVLFSYSYIFIAWGAALENEIVEKTA